MMMQCEAKNHRHLNVKVSFLCLIENALLENRNLISKSKFFG